MPYGKTVRLPYTGGAVPPGYKLKKHGTVLKQSKRAAKKGTSVTPTYVPMTTRISMGIRRMFMGY